MSIKKLFTNNLSWLILGVLIIAIGRTITGAPSSISGLIGDQMLPYTCFSLISFVAGAYVRSKYYETRDQQQKTFKILYGTTGFILLLFIPWLVKKLLYTYPIMN